MPIEIEFTKHRYMDQRFVTANSLWDGIVLWELQELDNPTILEDM